jgi:beta-lactamase regulating signal transducer with metallopeptidase domain/uncharacterized protein involved in exopolysaccharide biosynthesis
MTGFLPIAGAAVPIIAAPSPLTASPAAFLDHAARALGSEVLERLAWTLLHSLWQGAAVAAVLAIVLVLLRHRAPTTRYAAACLALLVIAAAPVVTYLSLAATQIPSRDSAIAAVGPAGSSLTKPLPLDSTLHDGRPARAIYIGPATDADPPPAVARTSAAPVAQTVTAVAPPPAPSLLAAVVLAWAIGVSGLSIWRVAGWIYLRRRLRLTTPIGEPWPAQLTSLAKRLGVARAVSLAEAAWVAVPAVVGILRPVILLPAAVLSGLTPNQLEAILAHELAHVRRQDLLVNLLQAVLETVMFYHPAMWWVSARIREEREHCCDDLAAAVAPSRVEYAAGLATMELVRGDRPLPAHLALAVRGRAAGPLLRRVRRLLGLPAGPRTTSTRHLAAAVIAAACVVAPLSAERFARGQGEAAESGQAEKKKPAATAPSQDDSKRSQDEKETLQKSLDEVTRQIRDQESRAGPEMVDHFSNYNGKRMQLDALLQEQTKLAREIAGNEQQLKTFAESVKKGTVLPEVRSMLNRDGRFINARQRIDDMDIVIDQLALKLGGDHDQVVANRKLRDAYQKKLEMIAEELHREYSETYEQTLRNQAAALQANMKVIEEQTARLKKEIEELGDASQLYRNLRQREKDLRERIAANAQRNKGATGEGTKSPREAAPEVDPFKPAAPPATRPVGGRAAGAEPADELAAAAGPPAPEDLVADHKNYEIARNDLVTIKILDLAGPGVETVKTTRVTESGTISLPFLGLVPAEGKTEFVLEETIRASYEKANIIRNANVSVAVAEARGRTFSVLGGVAQPGQYAIVAADFRLLDALVQSKANVPEIDTIYIVRKSALDPADLATARQQLADMEKRFGEAHEQVVTYRKLLNAAANKGDAADIREYRRSAVDLELTIRALKAQLGENHPSVVARKKELDIVQAAAQQPRVIAVPARPLAAGDPTLNIVIRPGDRIIARGSDQTPARLVVAANGTLSFRGERTTWTDLPRLLERIPAAQRGRSTLVVAPASDDMTLRQLNDAEQQAAALGREYGFKEVTVLRTPATATPPARSTTVPAND